MAHSQGGLVTQAALSKKESVGKVNRVLTLGTPFLGATKALGMLQYQSPCFVDEILGHCSVNKATAQEIFTNFPGAYQLLPSRDFHKVEGSPLILNRQNKSYDYWTGLIERDRNPFLMGFADAYQQAQTGRRPADSSVEWRQLVGNGVSTPNHIRYYGFCLIGSVSLTCQSSEVEFDMGPGDGTVPLHSASLYNEEKGVDLRNGIKTVEIPAEHGELPKSGPVLGYANGYFNEAAPSSAGASSFSAQSSTEEPSPKALAEEFGLDDTPTGSFGGIELESVGAVEGYVEDENGNVLGNPPDAPEGLIVEEIPGGQYNAIQDTQSFFLNKDGSFTSNLEVTNKEGARLRVRTYDEGEKTGQAVFQVAAPEGSELQVDFTNGQELPDLKLSVDEDGDGNAERQEEPDSVATGPAASDTTPPEAEASYEKTNSDKAQVTIKATDNEGGSGIASIYYSIEGQDSQPRLYEEPFTAPLGSVVHFTAVDKAGNTTGAKEIKIGEKPPPPDDDDGGNGGGGGPRACTITGTNGSDVLRGTRSRDIICGLGGEDIIRGRGGNDIIRGGSARDILVGGPGHDKIFGQRGRDILRGQGGRDRLIGGSGRDILSGGPGRDKIFGQGGWDVLRGQGGRDTLLGGKGRDVLVGGPGKDRLRGGPGRDIERQ